MDFEKSSLDYTLCLVTDRDLMSTKRLEEAVEEAILGGVTMVQLREKEVSAEKMYNIAQSIKKITNRYEVPLIINDRVDVALAVNAAGVHVGQSDIPASAVRKIISNEMILGVSATNLEEAEAAQNDGADYLGIGAMFATITKKDAKLVSIMELKSIRDAIDIPIIVIGGIDETNVGEFKGTGIDGFAVVSAIIAKPDIRRAAAELRDAIKL